MMQRNFSPIPESITSLDNGSSSETYLEDEDSGIDDIFEQLKSLSSSSSKITNKKILSEREKFNELKKSVFNLPSIKTTALDNPSEFLKNKKREAKINEVKKLNDPITSALPSGSNGGKKIVEKSISEKWFELPKVELTEKMKRDLTILKNRSSIDPKRHYKKDASWKIPEAFHVGTIMTDASDFYTRIDRKKRGTGFVDELLKDDESKKWFKRKYSEVQEKKLSGGKAYYKKVQEKRRRF